MKIPKYQRESASRAEGMFPYPIRRHTKVFWEALAFIVVKGINEQMLLVLTSAEIDHITGGFYSVFRSTGYRCPQTLDTMYVPRPWSTTLAFLQVLGNNISCSMDVWLVRSGVARWW